MSLSFPQIRVPVSLHRLFPQASFVGCADIRVVHATEVSGHCLTGSLFAALPGTKVNGASFVQDAVEHGATSLLVEEPLTSVSIPQCVVQNVREAYAVLCSALAGTPSQKLTTVGVTGTNGKTTVSWILRSIFEAAHKQTGLLGTIEYHDSITSHKSTLTTPTSQELADWLGRMHFRGASHAALELSSHALHQDRAAGTQLDAAIVTNITQDHFDYHQTQDAYSAAKAKIASLLKTQGTLILNADDPGSLNVQHHITHSFPPRITYGLFHAADISAVIQDQTLQGSRFVLRLPESEHETSTALVGTHNISNCLAAAAAAHSVGISAHAIVQGIETLERVPGRLQRIPSEQPFDVLIDYAHTDDALRRSLQTLKDMTDQRVIAVFGAGGDRDQTKRPLMGRAATVADELIITSDNPRSEEPNQIIEDILTGIPSQQPVRVEPDRAAAVEQAIALAEPGDCVLIAGKGHECHQEIGDQHIPFDDAQVATEALSACKTHSKKKSA